MFGRKEPAGSASGGRRMLVKARAIEPATVVPYRSRKEVDTWRFVDLDVEVPEIDPSLAPVVLRLLDGRTPRDVRLGPSGYLEPAGEPGASGHRFEAAFSAWRDWNLHADVPDLWRIVSDHSDRAVGEARRYALYEGRERTVASDGRGAEQYAAWIAGSMLVVDGVLHVPRLPPLLRPGDGYGRRLLTTTTVGKPASGCFVPDDWFLQDCEHADAWDPSGEGVPAFEIVDREELASFDVDGWRLRQGCVSLVNHLSGTGGDGLVRLAHMSDETIAAFGTLRDRLVDRSPPTGIAEAALELARNGDRFPRWMTEKSVSFVEAACNAPRSGARMR